MLAISGATGDSLSLVVKVIEAAQDGSIVDAIKELYDATVKYEAAADAARTAKAEAEAKIAEAAAKVAEAEAFAAETKQRREQLKADEADYNARIETLRAITR